MKKTLTTVLFLVFFLFSCSDFVNTNNALQDDRQPFPEKKIFLGYGYDVINSSYINRRDVKISHPILDMEKMLNDDIIISESIAGEQDFQMFVGSNLTEFYKDQNSSMNLGFDLSGIAGDLSGIAGILFSGKFGFEFSNAMSENRVDSSSYLRGRSYRYTQDDYIKGATAQKLLSYLAEDFTDALQTKNASQIIDLYGTHVLIRYYKGGSLEFNYTYTGNSLSSTAQKKSALQASYAGISSNYSNGPTTAGKELEENSLFHYYSYGGKSIDAFDLQGLKAGYGVWLNSIKDNADICGIGDFNQSLISLWELAEAAGYLSKANELESEFNLRAVRAGKALLVKKIKTEIKEFRSNDTYSFDASIDNPAEIEIYALGAGGGGQSGHTFGCGFLWLGTCSGTGAAGGGGAVAYLKLITEESISFSITVGKGGAGGSYSGNTGGNGGNGGTTIVKWNAKGITLNADGGIGGKPYVGGQGGRGSLSPTQHILYKDQDFKNGYNGWNGCGESRCESKGGTSAKLEYKGSQSPFPSAAGTGLGDGGSGSYSYDSGKSGGNGLVLIVVKHYAED
jgi:hypothetical protein